MSNATPTGVGAVASLWRYPVKSMQGEELDTAQMGEYGVLGDRAYAVLDSSDGKVATAKNPRKWPNLFAFRAAFVEPPASSATMPAVRITLPDGTSLTSAQSDFDQRLSKALGREVTLAKTERGRVAGVRSSVPPSWQAKSEQYWPDMEGLEHRDTVTDFALPVGTFFDCATVLVLTTATLKRLGDFYREGRFAVQRFRPNLVMDSLGENGFVENAWIGRMLAIGEDVRLNVTAPCGRCVMTTLAQENLPKDPGIFRTLFEQNRGNVGVYATVVRCGQVRRGDPVRLCD